MEVAINRPIEVTSTYFVNQLWPTESIGEVPCGSLSCTLIHLACSEHSAEFDYFRLLGERFDWHDVVFDSWIWFFLPVFEANGHYFEFANFTGFNILEAAHASAAIAG